jgi:hypothetical protein
MRLRADGRWVRSLPISNRAALVALLISFLIPQLALASSTFKPYGGVRYDDNSNVFAMSDEVAAASGTVQDDSIISYVGGFKSTFEWGRQKLVADFDAADVNYQRYENELNHDEFGLVTAWDWEFTSLLDGELNYKQQRRMAPFADKAGTQLSVENGKTGSASLNLNVTSSWRLESLAKYYDLKSPQTNVADFRMIEKTAEFGIKYVGYASLSFGLEGHHVDGEFQGTRIIEVNGTQVATDIKNISPPYTQDTAQLEAHYTVSGLSLFNALLGYTTRDEKANGANQTHATTGQFDYQRQITGKTFLTLQFTRAINSYVTTASSQIDTGGALQLAWTATGKTSFQFQYQYTRSDFGDQRAIGPRSIARVDDFQVAELNITYDMLRWFSIRPFVHYQYRQSNFDEFGFKGTEVGVELRAFVP